MQRAMIVALSAAALLLVGACARQWVRGVADRNGENCVWMESGSVTQRVINYSDPALCGRPAVGPARLAVRTAPK